MRGLIVDSFKENIMGSLLSTYTTGRDNNFNLVRFVAALLVLYSHSFALAIGSGDAEPPRALIGMSWGNIAVDIFFITSGFLITGSYLSRNNLIAFAWARILRIYPALIVAVMFCVFVVGLYFTTLTVLEYFSDAQTYKFMFKNILLFFGVEYKLPGVFQDNPYKYTVNGSLWTLPYEVKMYTMLAFILSVIVYLQKRLNFLTIKNTLLSVALFSVILHIGNHFGLLPLPDNFIKLFYMFFVGSAFYAWKDRIQLSSWWFFVALILLLVSTANKDIFFVFYSLLLPYLTLYIAYVPSGHVRKFNQIGDYSYGIYVYAFPVQQSMAALVPNISVSAMIIYSLSITMVLSMTSWHLIEKRFLKMKGSYIFIERFMQKTGLIKGM